MADEVEEALVTVGAVVAEDEEVVAVVAAEEVAEEVAVESVRRVAQRSLLNPSVTKALSL